MHMKTPRFQLAHRGSACELVGVRGHGFLLAWRTLVSLAVGACLVALELDEVLERCAVLLSAISGGIGPPRHCGGAGRVRVGGGEWQGFDGEASGALASKSAAVAGTLLYVLRTGGERDAVADSGSACSKPPIDVSALAESVGCIAL